MIFMQICSSKRAFGIILKGSFIIIVNINIDFIRKNNRFIFDRNCS